MAQTQQEYRDGIKVQNSLPFKTDNKIDKYGPCIEAVEFGGMPTGKGKAEYDELFALENPGSVRPEAPAGQEEPGNPEDPAGPDPSTGGNPGTVEIPEAGTLYNGCFVLGVSDHGEYADILLLSPNSATAGKSRTQINNEGLDLGEYIGTRTTVSAVTGIGGWRLPSLDELILLNSLKDQVNAAFNESGGTAVANSLFLYNTGETVKYHRLSLGSDSSSDREEFASGDVVRPFTSVRVDK